MSLTRFELSQEAFHELHKSHLEKWVPLGKEETISRSKRSLWVRVILAIHGVDGRIGRAGNVGYTSIWCDIIKEMDRLTSHGIDLISMMHKKIGNVLNTSFWEDRWSGGND
nr:hypothetical protein [Tanacetum cinerariifolium]